MLAPPPWSLALIAFTGYLALSVLLFIRAWMDPFHVAIGNNTDALLGMWFLKWTPFALAHGQSPLATTYLDYPKGANLMWNGSTPLLALLAAPLTSLLGMIFTYNLLVTLALPLSAWAAYLLIRRFAGGAAAALGGLIFGFSPFLAAHALGHLPLVWLVLPPLLLLLVHEAVVRQERGWVVIGLGLGLLGAAQLLLSEEVLLLSALVAAIGTLLLAALYPAAIRARAPFAIRAVGLGAAVFVVASSVPLAVQFLGPQRVHGIVQGPNTFVSDLLGFVVPSRIELIAPASAVRLTDQFTGGLAEATTSYLGIGLFLLLSVFALRRWSDPVVKLTVLLGTVLAVLSLGQTIHIAGHVTHVPVFVLALAFPLLQSVLPGRLLLYLVTGLWLALIRLPVLDNILPVRFMLFDYLIAGLLLAMAVSALARGSRRRSMVLGGAAVAASLALLLPAWPYPASAPTAPDFFRDGSVRAIPDGSVALLAPFSRASVNGLWPVYWQAVAEMRFKMPEGYIFVPGGSEAYQAGGASPNPPPSTTQRVLYGIEQGTLPGMPDDGVQHEMLRELQAWNVETVIVGPMPHRQDVVDLFTSLLGRSPTEEGGVDVWLGVQPGA